MRARGPRWFASPSRFAGIGVGRARWAVALLALAMTLSLQALFVAVEPGTHDVGGVTLDELIFHQDVIAGLTAGGDYYDVTADALRASGDPLRPFLAFRLPTLSVIVAATPPLLLQLVLAVLAIAVGWTWIVRLREAAAARGAVTIVATILLAAGLVLFVQPGLAAIHEVWAALLVALSLALRRPRIWLSAVAIGLSAALLRETAALYLIVMAALAWLDGERREAAAWSLALALFGLVLGIHALAANGVPGPLDSAASALFIGHEGLGLFARAAALATAFGVLPMLFAAPLVILGMAGWASWRSDTGLRVFLTLAAFGLAIALFGGPDRMGWGLMAAPLLPLGLAFVPDGLRDLIAAALDMRRVRVQRITR